MLEGETQAARGAAGGADAVTVTSGVAELQLVAGSLLISAGIVLVSLT